MIRVQSAIALLLVLATVSQAQICPPPSPANREDYASTYERLSFPVPLNSDSVSFNVTDNQNKWILMFTGYNLDVTSYVDSTVEDLRVSFGATLVNKQTGASYLLLASGPISFLSIRGSPDFRWVTLQDIWIPGVADSLTLNVSISYADFWTDSPADSIYHIKHEEVYPGTECTYRYAQNGGNNFIQNKNFWIQIYFSNGRQAAFNIPQGYYGSYARSLFALFYTDCICP